VTSEMNIELSKMTGARQTMLSWARGIESLEMVPQPFQSSYKSAVGDIQKFPYTVFTPSFSSLKKHRTTEKLLSEIDDTLCIWEHTTSGVTLTEYPLKDVSDFEVGAVLLFSWIRVNGVTKSGMANSTTIEYNTVTERYFTPFVNRLRSVLAGVEGSGLQTEKDKFGFLAVENFKFMNYAIQSLSSGEKVLQTVLQPKISKPRIILAGHVLFQTILSLAHLAILTDRELIVIEDIESDRGKPGAHYGGKWQYIPLKNITGISLLDLDGNLPVLSLTLSPTRRQVEFIFNASKKQELSQLRGEIEKLMTK
jgi:hypothetical protein